MDVGRRTLLALFSVCVVAGCGPAPARPSPPAPSNVPVHDDALAPLTGPIRVGVILPMTGASAPFGWTTLAGVKLAVAERNAAGGVRGAMVELVELDTMGKASDAAAAAERLVTHDHVVAIIGEATSGSTLAAAAVAQEHGVPLITPSATNIEVTRVGDRIFRACFVDDAQARAMARFARTELHAARVAILADETSPYSLALATAFAADFTARGGTVALDLRYQGGGVAMPVLKQIITAKADAIYVPGYYTDVGQIAIILRGIGVAAPLLGGDGWDSTELGAIAGQAIDGSYYTNHFAIDDPGDVPRAFATRFAAAQGAPPDSLAALGYDATLVLLDAMARAPTLDGAELAAAIATTTLDGATGSISFGGGRDPAKSVVVLQMKAQLPHFAATMPP